MAQSNLVTNPSFEDIDSCYGQASGLGFDVYSWSGCVGWIDPTYGSSDLWCNNPVLGTETPPNITGFGYQFPRTGNNMAGLFITQSPSVTYREYIQNQLTMPLEAGKYYQIGFYVNSADTFNYSSDIGVYFSNTAISQNTSYSNLPYVPQFKNPIHNFITDTVGWQKISGIYKATGGEKYITIGCFNDSSQITLSNNDPLTAGGVYLFIDDFELNEIPSELNIPNVFTPNNDGQNDLFSLQLKNIENWQCAIYNRWGEKIFVVNESTPFWNGANYSDGTYYYMFSGETSKKEIIKENGFLQLLR